MFIGLRNCPSAMAHSDGGFSLVIAFGPYWARRLAASPALSPAAASVPSSRATSAASTANGGGFPVVSPCVVSFSIDVHANPESHRYFVRGPDTLVSF